ncbi:neuroguidin-like [Dysidea avara]|uniref:neuroguidin-like n=1 Tax=Dysidea avara TaxID=196820 RepID=UPI00331F50C5
MSRVSALDKVDTVDSEIPQYLRLLDELASKAESNTQHVTNLLERINGNDCCTNEGVSLLEIKFHLLLSYLINLTHVMQIKVRGQSINGCASVLRLVEIRTILEKIRPLELRLNYQIDKLVKMAATGNALTNNHPLHFRPNPDNLVSKLDESGSEEEEGSDDEDDGSKDKQSNKGVYVPPKLVAAHFSDEKVKRRQMLLRKSAMNASVLDDLREEYSEAPLELQTSTQGLRKRKMIDREKEQQKFEEDNFVRLNMKRKKSDNVGRHAAGVVNELTDFGGLRAMTGDTARPSRGKNPKRKTMSKKQKIKLFKKKMKRKK